MARLYLLFVLFSFLFLASANISSKSRALLKSRYSKAHSLGDSYQFGPLDGWRTVNITNLSYKDNDAQNMSLLSRDNMAQKETKHVSFAGHVAGIIEDVFRGLKAFGKSQTTKITWYTGHDLLNPNCWSESNWAPTDESFICAINKEGWNGGPQCFDFVQLCNGIKRCIFARVVDSCAGCEPGKPHIDLTKKGFSELGDLDKGWLMVTLRKATKPGSDAWFEDLWGPVN